MAHSAWIFDPVFRPAVAAAGRAVFALVISAYVMCPPAVARERGAASNETSAQITDTPQAAAPPIAPDQILTAAAALGSPSFDALASDALALEAVTVSGGGNLLQFSLSPTAPGGDAADEGPGTGAGAAPGLLYFTPRVTNFGVGLGHQEEACKFISPEFSGASCYTFNDIDTDPTPALAADPEPRDSFAIGVAYQQRLKDIDLGVSTTVVSSPKDSDGLSPVTPELQSWKLDFTAGYTGFTFSTSFFEDRARGDGGKRDEFSGVGGQEVFDLGVKYDQGPWAFGVQYSHSEMDTLSIGPELGDQKIDAYEIGGSYFMGPRLSLGAAVQFWKWDEYTGSAVDDDQASDLLFLVGSHFKF
ncbi:MAG: porin [Rhodospirillales bacterium]|nr:porin [Rhodospirillales bacterium]